MTYHATPLVTPAAGLPDDDLGRLAHQLILAGHGAEGQRRLRNAKVLVVGADEVGGPALAHLADAGVGTLGIADGAPLCAWDRCLGHPPAAALGSPRAEAWRTALSAAYPTLTAHAHTTRLDETTAKEIIDGYDVVVCAAEDPARCYLVDDACALLGKPFVWAGFEGVRGAAAVFWDPHGPTYRDLHPDPPAAYFRGMAGTLSAAGAWLAATLTMEVVKLVTGSGDPLIGRLIRYDARAATCAVEPVPRDPGRSRPDPLTAAPPYFGLLSPEAAEAARESTISAEELKALLDAEPGRICVVDVREPDEYALAHLPDSTLIPKGEFFGGDGLARLPRDRQVVFLCRMGIRSAEVLAVAKRHGHPHAVHLGGGILAWAERVDPRMPRY